MARPTLFDPICAVLETKGSLTRDSADEMIHRLNESLGSRLQKRNVILEVFSGQALSSCLMALHGHKCIALDTRISLLVKSQKLFQESIRPKMPGKNVTWCLGVPLELSNFTVRGVTVINAFSIPPSLVDEQLHMLDLFDRMDTAHTLIVHVQNLKSALKRILKTRQALSLVSKKRLECYKQWWNLLTEKKEDDALLKRTIEYQFDVTSNSNKTATMAIVAILRPADDRVDGYLPRIAQNLDSEYSISVNDEGFCPIKVEEWKKGLRDRNKAEKKENIRKRKILK